MGSEKDTTQKKNTPGQLGEGADIQRSMAPPAQLFADGGGGGASLETPSGGGGFFGSFKDLLAQVVGQVGGGPGDGAKALEGGAKAGASALAGAQAKKDPSNKFVPVNDRDTHKISDAIVGNLDAAVKKVNSLTGVDIGTGFGDTTRALDFGTKKVGADNFSWHKSGRAIDFNQGLKWVIAKSPNGKEMFFRLYLEANEAGAKSAYAKTFTKEEVPNLHSNGMGGSVTKKPVVDVTAILEENGFERIPAHDGWESSYNKREWWHYVKDDGLTWYQALRQIYTDAEIVTAMKKLVADRHVHTGRLGRREGFPGATLKAIWDNKPITMGKLSLFFSVGSNENCVNLPEDVAAVKAALKGLGIAENDNVAVMISAYQVKKGGKADGYITVNGGTHGKIGAEMK